MDTKKIEELLKSAFGDATPTTEMLFDPQVVDSLLRDKSPLIVQVPIKPPREYLVDLYEQRKIKALDIIESIPPVLAIGRQAIQQLYEETRECIMFGVYGASITLCGVLIEFVLKYVTYHWNIPEREFAFDLALWDSHVEKTQFKGAIVRAKAHGVINEEEAVQLTYFKDEVRNPYSHYNLKKLAKNIVIPTKRVNVYKGTCETVDMMAEETPPFYPIAKKWRDERAYLAIHIQTYNIAKVLLKRLDNRILLLDQLHSILRAHLINRQMTSI